MATAIGVAWATEMVASLQRDEREVIGPWPGTIGEARMRVLGSLRLKLDLAVLQDLARIANVAARQGWLAVAARDPEA